MLNSIKNMLLYLGAHYKDVIVAVMIMVSAIIFLIGLAKPFLFDRIKNKDFRKAALAGSNVALSFLSALSYFLIEDWNFKYYVIASIALSFACILTYYVYETIPGMRKVIGGLGYAAICKVFNVALLAASGNDTNDVKTAIKKTVSQQLEPTAKQTLTKVTKKVKIDKDLIGL